MQQLFDTIFLKCEASQKYGCSGRVGSGGSGDELRPRLRGQSADVLPAAYESAAAVGSFDVFAVESTANEKLRQRGSEGRASAYVTSPEDHWCRLGGEIRERFHHSFEIYACATLSPSQFPSF